jgi:hypothetical protein
MDKGAARCRNKFLRYFPGGFRDETYLDWEREYKWSAHLAWKEKLSKREMERLLRTRNHDEIARRAVGLESKTNLLFSFEKMALRDAVRIDDGAKAFSKGLYEFIYGRATGEARFEKWCRVVEALPRRQTRVLTWPIVTVFGFIADPTRDIFLKPNVTRLAAKKYGFPFAYTSRPGWDTYASLLEFAGTVKRDNRDLRPRDMIDLQSFIWVQGSDEYP